MADSFHSANSHRSGSSHRSLNYFTPDSYDNKLVEDNKLFIDLMKKQVEEHKKILNRLLKSNKFYKTHKHDKFSRSALRGLQRTRTQSLRLFNKLKSRNDSTTRKLRESERGDFLRGGTRRRR
jgi:hypothetical protein